MHVAIAAILIVLAGRIERRLAPADFIKVALMPEAAPTPAPPPPVPLFPEDRAPPFPSPPIQHAVHVESKPQDEPDTDAQPPDEPDSESTPDVEVVPDATSSAGAIPVPLESGEGAGESIPMPGAGGLNGNGDANGPVSADAVAHPPEIVTYVVPVYPRMARERGIEGRVLLMVVVDEKGKVEDAVQVLDSVPMLDQAAIDAVHRWSFTPGRDAAGNPVRVKLQVPVRFTLR